VDLGRPRASGRSPTPTTKNSKQIAKARESTISDVGKTGIDPQRDSGEGSVEFSAKVEMVASAGDGIEIGDIEDGRVGDGKQGAGYGHRNVGQPERRFERPVIGPLTRAGMDNPPSLRSMTGMSAKSSLMT
jgi:hypothetical protein